MLNCMIYIMERKLGTKSLSKFNKIIAGFQTLIKIFQFCHSFGPEDYYVDVAGNYNENLICIAQATVLYIYSPAHNVYKKYNFFFSISSLSNQIKIFHFLQTFYQSTFYLHKGSS